ncbi:MAG: DUF2834 domain-containing protein [Deltaproteobacteria bacterium]|jgi:hypothetical protein|nr:DUF2834 domain-containing protein [Deltaproteobacteria bacterium]
MKRTLLILTLVAFSVLSAMAVWHHGYWGIFELQFKSFAGAQVLADLVIALVLFLIWMWRDAKVTRRNPWPWIVLTLAAGSFGALIYLLLAPEQKKTPRE